MKEKNINALLIGFMSGVLVYGVVNNNLGLWVLLPLVSIYLIIKGNSSKNDKGEK